MCLFLEGLWREPPWSVSIRALLASMVNWSLTKNRMSTQPQSLSAADWKELGATEEVREQWGAETPEERCAMLPSNSLLGVVTAQPLIWSWM